MQRISFTPNQQVLLFGKICTIESVTNEEVTIRRESGARSSLAFTTLLKHHAAGNLRASKQSPTTVLLRRPEPRRTGRLLSDMSPRQRDEAKQRFQLLNAVGDDLPLKRHDRAIGEVIRETASALGIASPPSIGTLKTWRAELRRSGGDPMSLAPRFDRRGGRGKLRYPKAVLQEMDAVIDNFYLTPNGLSGREVYKTFAARLHEKNLWLASNDQLPVPHYATFVRRIHQYDGYEVVAARHGARAAMLRYRQVGMNTELPGFNECWEVDHTMMDVIVVDPKTKQAIARPWITVMIEHVTRAVMGFHIGLGSASTQSVLSCLKHAVRPKTYLSEKYPEIQGMWPCFGLPLIIKCDNGREFHAKTLADAGDELGIEFIFCGIKKPWFKGRIERFFGTLNTGLLNSLPGATGNTPKARKDVGLANLPVIDMETLDRLLHNWIVDVYMIDDHKGVR